MAFKNITTERKLIMNKLSALIFCVALTPLLSCEDSVVSGLTAEEIFFDNMFTNLSSDNVQNALSELGRKPDVLDRLQYRTNVDQITDDGLIIVRADCSELDGDFQYVGGGCRVDTGGSSSSTLTLISSGRIQVGGFEGNERFGHECRWIKDDNTATFNFIAEVTCLEILE